MRLNNIPQWLQKKRLGRVGAWSTRRYIYAAIASKGKIVSNSIVEKHSWYAQNQSFERFERSDCFVRASFMFCTLTIRKVVCKVNCKKHCQIQH